MPPYAFEQNLRWIDDGAYLSDFLDGGVDVLVPDDMHPRGSHRRSAANSDATVDEDSAPADVLGYSIYDAVKFADGDWAVVRYRNADVTIRGRMGNRG